MFVELFVQITFIHVAKIRIENNVGKKIYGKIYFLKIKKTFIKNLAR